VASYLVRPVTIDLIRNARTPRARTATETTTAS
jgi:hypothetical protein